MTATPGMFWAAMVTMYNGRAMLVKAATVRLGAVTCRCGVHDEAAGAVWSCTNVTASTSRAAPNAAGTAQRGRVAATISHTASTGAITAGSSASAVTGAMHSGSSTPANMA